jgi:hypothetical protein
MVVGSEVVFVDFAPDGCLVMDDEERIASNMEGNELT